MVTKQLFISSIPIIELQGNSFIPTILFYENDGKYRIGNEAIRSADGLGADAINEDFKIDLGNEETGFGKGVKRFQTSKGIKKSAGELTGDFLSKTLEYVREWLGKNHAAEGAGIMIAEPITMNGEAVNEKWLTNYRDAIRRILLGKGFTKEQINFMPEPFAVFQYYKYGLKHPLLGESKQCALVLDFGGGSFDVCIIESDREGEVSGKMKNTRPHAASSAAVGGFFINRVLAEQLLKKYVPNDKSKVGKGLEVYRKWRSGENDLSTVSADLKSFVKNFNRVAHSLEESKIALCNQITNWDIEANLGGLAAPVRLPKNPFAEDTTFADAQITAMEFREWFIRYVWKSRLEPVIKQALERGTEALMGAPISVVLLSGGSCNIRWFEKLVEHDFHSSLEGAQILQVESDFLEVVAKGLAIECTRRFYDENGAGDFSAITYNGLNLILDPDNKGLQLKKYIPTQDNPVPPTNKQCVLVPAASILRNHFDKKLTWKVKLGSPPRHNLNYYFLRSGLSPFKDESFGQENELKKYSDDLLNLEYNNAVTPKDTDFDNHILIELKIEQERKSANVSFIYAHNQNGISKSFVDGKPFYIDITDTQESKGTKAYIGLDFGTSNTSASFISQATVKTYEKRAKDKQWHDLSDLHLNLPYPMAAPLAKYLRESGQHELVNRAREFTEAALAMISYVSYLEMCQTNSSIGAANGKTKYFKSFTQRSVGPLWALFRDTQKAMGERAGITGCLKDLLGSGLVTEIDKSITFFGEHKHEKRKDQDFNPNIVNILANFCNKIFSRYRFGHFENVQQKGFKQGQYSGQFRFAESSNIHFIESHQYSGSYCFPTNQTYLVDFDKRVAIPLYPLIFRYQCEEHQEIHYFIYDLPNSDKTKSFSYKAVDSHCKLQVSDNHEELTDVYSDLYAYKEGDPFIELTHF